MSGDIALQMAWTLVVVVIVQCVVNIALLLGIREARHKAQDAHRRLDIRQDLERLNKEKHERLERERAG